MPSGNDPSTDDPTVYQQRRRSPANPLLDRLVAYEALAGEAAERKRLWSAFVQSKPSEQELTALRRSTQTGLPFGAPGWVEQLGRQMGLELAIR